jgi:hypothetical protein
MKIQIFTAIIHKEDDVYIAECPEDFVGWALPTN